jgi:molybdate transport system ATP-binding protein
MTDRLVARFEKRFAGGVVVAAEVAVPAREFSVTVLFGPSGGGKTTILRCLAGLERPEEGCIEFAGQTWFDAQRRICLSPQQRDIGFLFQEYALFPHLTVADNIGYSLAGLPRGERGGGVGERVAEMLERFDLTGLGERFPRQISGGQQQRVALARALARRPRLLLLDEPLSALDSDLRNQLRRELRQRLASFAIPVVIVTHDRQEAASLADQVIVLSGGRVIRSGPPAAVLGEEVPDDAVRMPKSE